jgi:hypothetical protein
MLLSRNIEVPSFEKIINGARLSVRLKAEQRPTPPTRKNKGDRR